LRHEFVNPHMGWFIYSLLHGLNDIVGIMPLVASPTVWPVCLFVSMHGRLLNTNHMITKLMFSALEFYCGSCLQER